MKINTNIIQLIIKLQEENKIEENKLLVFSLSLNAGVITAVKTIQEELNLLDEEIVSFTKLLIENELLTKNDLSIIQKLEKTSLITMKTFDDDVAEILNHLNVLTNTKKKVTDKKVKLIEQWLRRGYSLEQFFMVNLYFNDKWGSDPEMSSYIRAETLYNTKFESRVEEAEDKFKKIIEKKDDIRTICNFYKGIFEELICPIDISCNFLPLKLQEKMAFWLNKFELNIIIKNNRNIFKYLV
jgi:uncharacterized phage protein (TIGR02220 family)